MLVINQLFICSQKKIPPKKGLVPCEKIAYNTLLFLYLHFLVYKNISKNEKIQGQKK